MDIKYWIYEISNGWIVGCDEHEEKYVKTLDEVFAIIRDIENGTFQI